MMETFFQILKNVSRRSTQKKFVPNKKPGSRHPMRNNAAGPRTFAGEISAQKFIALSAVFRSMQ